MSWLRHKSHRLSYDDFLTLRVKLLGRQIPGTDPAPRSEYECLLGGGVRLSELVEHWNGSIEAHRNQPYLAERSRKSTVGHRYRDIRAGMTRQLVHAHVPKTAGTSINSHLAKSLDPERLYTQRPIREILSYSFVQLLEAPFIACHGASLLLDVLPDDRVFFTVLREPCEQLWSHYEETRRAGLAENGFEEWCADENNWNPQARWLTMDWSCLRPDQPELHDNRRLDPDQLLTEAEGTLSRMACIGFTDRIETLLKRLAAVTGVGQLAQGSIGRLNVSERVELDVDLNSAMVRRATEVDRSLFDRARVR